MQESLRTGPCSSVQFSSVHSRQVLSIWHLPPFLTNMHIVANCINANNFRHCEVHFLLSLSTSFEQCFCTTKGSSSSHHASHTLISVSCDQQSVSVTCMSFETTSKLSVVEGAVLDVAMRVKGVILDMAMMVEGAILDIAMIVKGAILDVAIARQPNH